MELDDEWDKYFNDESNETVKNTISEYKNNMKNKLHIQDVKCKYEINDNSLYNNDMLSSSVENTQEYTQVMKNLELLRTGKVRDIFKNNYDNFDEETYFMVASDRVSAFDRHLTTIPYKGFVLHKVSNWWFEQTKDIVPNHLISSPDEQVLITK